MPKPSSYLTAVRAAGRAIGGVEVERIAPGVEVVRGGFPHKTMNAYLIEDEKGVALFDTGIKAMARPLRELARRRGGLNRIVLGHAHADHRGAAALLDAPVLCHPLEKDDAEGDGGLRYFDFARLDRFKIAGRHTMPLLLRSWDAGPVQITRTLAEGELIADFEVVHLPGHAPGMIALWRESDRLALVSDAFYLLDPHTGRPSRPSMPAAAFSCDAALAARSLRTLAGLEPVIAAPGHLGPLTGDVAKTLNRIVDAAPLDPATTATDT